MPLSTSKRVLTSRDSIAKIAALTLVFTVGLGWFLANRNQTTSLSSKDTRVSQERVDSPLNENVSALKWHLFSEKQTSVYALQFRSENATLVAPFSGLRAELDNEKEQTKNIVKVSLLLDVDLQVRSFARRQNRMGLGFEVVSCRSASLVFQGDEMLGNVDKCEGVFSEQELFVEVDDIGKLQRLYPEKADLAAQVLRILAAEFQLIFPSPGQAVENGSSTLRWASLEETPMGLVWSETSHSFDQKIRRERRAYRTLEAIEALGEEAELSGSGLLTASLDEQGQLKALIGRESVLAISQANAELMRSKSVLKAHRKSHQKNGNGVFTTSRKGYTLQEIFMSENVDERLAQNQAGGLTRAGAVDLLKGALVTGKMVDHTHSLWRLQGALAVQESLIRDIEMLFVSPSATTDGRGLLLDVLAAKGNAKAQLAMRKMLSSETAVADKGFPILYQRLGLLDAPDGETLSFARRYFEESLSQRQNVELLAAYTLGAVLGKVVEGESAAADRANALLQNALAKAETPDRQMHLLKALANAARPDNQVEIAEWVDDENSNIRIAVARAMRRPALRPGVAILLKLTQDEVLAVQVESLRALRHHELTGEDLEALGSFCMENKIHRRNEREFLDLLKHQMKEHPQQAKKALLALAVSSKDGEVKAAARLLADTTRR